MQSKIALLILAATIAAAFLATNLTTSAFAQQLPQSGFGQGAKGFAPGEMGQHSQAGSTFVGSPPNFDNVGGGDPGVPGREGIGNVAKNLGFDSVGELGCALDPNPNC